VHILSDIRFIFRLIVLGCALFLPAGQAWASLNILACEPEWAALAVEIGGEHVSVSSATTAMQDPHHVQARPSLIAKARRADLLICSGAGLEAGWLPVLIKKSANPRIRPGKPGHLLASKYVELLGGQATDKGGLHSKGNPHIHFDPHKLLTIAQTLAQAMATIDSDNAKDFNNNLDHFTQDWNKAIQAWQQQAGALKGKPVIVHHDSWVYLFAWLGIKQVATLEPRHGVPPSSGHLASLLDSIKTQPADMIIRSGYEDPRPSQWLADKSGIPVVTIPFSVTDYQIRGNLRQWMGEVMEKLGQGK